VTRVERIVVPKVGRATATDVTNQGRFLPGTSQSICQLSARPGTIGIRRNFRKIMKNKVLLSASVA
jgi:hypothetical protein